MYADVVLNHKLGADQEEKVEATPYSPDDRNHAIGEMQKIKVWTHFTFPGRQGKYSDMEWHWWHFDAVDYNVYNEGENAVYLFKDKHFNDDALLVPFLCGFHSRSWGFSLIRYSSHALPARGAWDEWCLALIPLENS
ncbi:hypothetical protein [Nostoc sp.]|uniref:hypothetical protein n=1 Tax=Nostoc sp. TaxID=1180 RepID=UPI002FFB8392